MSCGNEDIAALLRHAINQSVQANDSYAATAELDAQNLLWKAHNDANMLDTRVIHARAAGPLDCCQCEQLAMGHAQ